VTIGINSSTASTRARETKPGAPAAATAEARHALTPQSSTDDSGSVSLSATSRQLAQSAVRAEQRDASMSRTELAAEAKKVREQICGAAYNAALVANEVPDTDDPELLARARQATAFTQAYGRSSTVENPFKHLSDDQLTLVMYDDSGSYTINERRAAWLEQYDRREAWAQKVVAQAHLEYKTTGQNDRFFQACIDYYEALPPIEQAQYPVDYVARRQHWIENNKPWFEGDLPTIIDAVGP